MKKSKREPHMLPKTTGVASVGGGLCTAEGKGSQSGSKLIASRMSQSLVPKVNRGSGGVKSLMCRRMQRIEITIDVTSELHLMGAKVLYGETIRIEFD
jgi:hypothetical protein